ncbi:envelope-like protein [Cucumis melo var. makuwa]|uniref:Envelope-like protein n=1 Tax=Cucumis melo var. makuwa TaxID=1194695 RepID=A0A5A7V1K3_CUCMM|nr:envelope-like protein [Cucumis melo var. makuwa]
MVQADSDSSDEEDNVVLSKLFHRMHESKLVERHSSLSPRPSTMPTPSMAPPNTSSHVKYDIPDDNAVNSSPVSMDDVPSPVRITVNTRVFVEDTTNDRRFEIPSPAAASASSVSLPDTPTSTHPYQQSSDLGGPSGHRKVLPNVPPIPLDVINYSFNEQLALQLSSGLVKSWPSEGQLSVACLSMKYAILHKIGIANWIPSTHASTVSATLGHFIYLVGTGARLNADEFIFRHLLRHVDTFGINIPICFPRLLYAFLLSQHVSLFTPMDAPSHTPKTLTLSSRLFQGGHVPNLPYEFCPTPGSGPVPSVSAATVPFDGLPLPYFTDHLAANKGEDIGTFG